DEAAAAPDEIAKTFRFALPDRIARCRQDDVRSPVDDFEPSWIERDPAIGDHLNRNSSRSHFIYAALFSGFSITRCMTSSVRSAALAHVYLRARRRPSPPSLLRSDSSASRRSSAPAIA